MPEKEPWWKGFFFLTACIFLMPPKKFLNTHQRKNFRFASNQVSRALTSVNKLPPGKFYLLFTRNMQFCNFDLTQEKRHNILCQGSFSASNWTTTNQRVYKAEPVIQRARSSKSSASSNYLFIIIILKIIIVLMIALIIAVVNLMVSIQPILHLNKNRPHQNIDFSRKKLSFSKWFLRSMADLYRNIYSKPL